MEIDLVSRGLSDVRIRLGVQVGHDRVAVATTLVDGLLFDEHFARRLAAIVQVQVIQVLRVGRLFEFLLLQVAEVEHRHDKLGRRVGRGGRSHESGRFLLFGDRVAVRRDNHLVPSGDIRV